VALMGSSRERVETTTDAAGGFCFNGLKKGNYRSSVEKDSYFPVGPQIIFGKKPPDLHVTTDNDSVPLRRGLVPPRPLRGRVTGPDGKPASKIEVTVIPRGLIEYTDEKGEFAFVEKLRPDTYSLRARPRENQVVSVEDGVRREVVPTDYPAPIMLHPGA